MATERNWHSAILPRKSRVVEVQEMEPEETAYVNKSAFVVGSDYSLYLRDDAPCYWEGKASEFYITIRREVTESFEVCFKRNTLFAPTFGKFTREDMQNLIARDLYYPVTRICYGRWDS